MMRVQFLYMKPSILFLIRAYQRFASPLFVSLFGQQCRFTPTCSEYAYQAIGRYGILYGSWLGVKRIVRCHPWSKGGSDPIPNLTN